MILLWLTTSRCRPRAAAVMYFEAGPDEAEALDGSAVLEAQAGVPAGEVEGPAGPGGMTYYESKQSRGPLPRSHPAAIQFLEP